MAEIGGLYWESHGRADAEPLILSPGLGGSGQYWQPNIAALAEQYRVIVYDHRGTGRSDRALAGRVTIGTMAEDVIALLDGLGIEKTHFLGHAAGGVIGLALALSAPERLAALIVVNGWSRLDPHFARCFETRLALLRDGGPRAYLKAQPIFLYPANWSSDHSAELDAELEAQLAAFPNADTIVRRVTALRSFDIDDRLAEINLPVMLVVSEDDMLVPAKCSHRLAKGISGAQLGVLGSGGHACNVTRPDMFNRLVLSWLSQAGH
ncbi:pyrimidine utilization protein D [Sphingomonas sp.]|jgi:aminoacrylate hydrolase|uniref:pyrimidine utilization protein D n=1 Tax=Sphingomonas sp. TaxID=28214 RepID=UPI002EDAB2F1